MKPPGKTRRVAPAAALVAALWLPVCARAADEPEQGWAMTKQQEALAGVTECKTKPSVDGADLMDALVLYGDACELVQDYDGAINAYRQALEANKEPFKNLKGDENLASLFRPRCIIYGKMGYVQLRQDKPREAEDSYRKAVGLASMGGSLRDSALAVARNGLAIAQTDRMNFDQAWEVEKALLDSCEKVFGKDHPETGRVLDAIILLHAYTGRLDKAEGYAKRLLRIRREAFGDWHPLVADALARLASIHHSKQEYDKALPLLEEVLAIRETAFDPEHKAVETARTNLAALKKAMTRE